MHNPNGTIRGEPQETAHAVNDEDAPNPRAVIGHNSSVSGAQRALVAHKVA
jgi:hypothetical protein